MLIHSAAPEARPRAQVLRFHRHISSAGGAALRI